MPNDDSALGCRTECDACGRVMVHINKTAAEGGWLVCASTLCGVGCEEPARWRLDRVQAAARRAWGVLVRLRFTPWTILADYQASGRSSALSWTKGVPLVQSQEDRDHYAE